MKFLYTFFFLMVSFVSFSQGNPLWKGYYSYQETKAIEKDDQNIYIATSNSVFAYNQYSKETEIYNTISGLKIEDIHALAYAKDYKKLIIGSTNGKVAIIDLATDKIYHLNDIYNKTAIPDNQKKINKITIHAGYAYLATGYGVTAVRLNDNHFGDTFYIGVAGEMVNVSNVAVLNNQLYAAVTNEGIKKASINSNLIDYNSWQVVDFSNWIDLVLFNNQLVGVKEDLSLNTISASNQITKIDVVWDGFLKLAVSSDILIEITHEAARLRSSDLGVYNEFVFSLADKGGVNDATFANGNYFMATKTQGALKVPYENKENIENVSPKGPISNDVSSVTLNNSDLWMTFGGYGINMDPYKPNGLTKYGISVMKNLQTWQEISSNSLNQLKSTVNVSFNPQKPNIAYISTFHDGFALYDETNKQVSILNQTNSPLQQVRVFSSQNEYVEVEGDVRVYGVSYDRNGNGWFTNELAMPFLGSIDKNNQIQFYNVSVFSGNSELFHDAFFAPIIDKNSTKWIVSKLNGLIAFNETKNNKSMLIDSKNNLPSNIVKSIALDYDNKLWIGTSKGIRVINNVDQFLTASQLSPANIVIEDEGKAQELFFEQDVLAITVDGSNNKWVSIADSGVFLISGSNYETIYKFTKENSPLPSNNIDAITIEGSTGEVFFVSRSGVVSFKNFATTPTANLDHIKVYPNPVKPGYTGDVKIAGLTSNANVKITDVAGNLVYETKSLGGTVTWNTLSFSGSKVPSGVYMIFVSSEDGTLDGVKKVMIIR
ncbi:T9SS type A sorting domain-containing protein [Flavobacterium sp. xlx-214]|uniref:type IX secretion system anionic LPS delivery protein PorZ n=1 Tax=unclassified Flavobacterium TaxID=196869 RepID=UPI0013D7EC9E|nr:MULTISPECIES: T9SS type A sorting domain-containing protein [unclassified Flavobacterium]MBA5793640.1 T9SS type A sorting domain-containing protein [Flavobacterium sp. xlx-221]QMI84568.1 T9SS type A sorting domain-containing protein [Flavobacterium sp. xlx-214]